MMASFVIEKDNFGQTINEPCSGSGRMVLAANQVTKGNYYVCEDLDPICCKMTAINLCFHEIRGEVHCHDTLKMDKPRFSLATNYEFWKNNTHSIFYYNNG
jgi:type I restriction enzyme M protein